MRDRSLVRQLSTNAAAPGPRTVAVPRCETSNRPTPVRTASCSASTPPPAYSMGIDQPPKSASLAPAATCRSCRGEVRGVTDGTLSGDVLERPARSGPRRPRPEARPELARGEEDGVLRLLGSSGAAHDLRNRPPAREALRRRRRRRRRQGS